MKPETNLPPRTRSRKQPKREKKAEKKRSRFRWGRMLLILFALVVLVVGGYAAKLLMQTKNAIQTISTNDDNGQVTVVPPQESVKVKGKAMVIMGIDHRRATGSLNTDVMMVAAFHPTTKSAVVVTIPRDSRIELDGYKSNKVNGYYARFLQEARTKDKLKQAAAEAQARNEMKEMLGKLFGIPITYSTVVNFKGFSEVIDALGGIEVDVDMDMRYVDKADGTNINLKKGFQQLNGDEALDFVRYRQSNDGRNMSSDFERNKRQSEVVGAVTDKLKTFGGVAKLGSVIEAVGDNITMDMPAKEIENMMATYFGISRENIQFITLEGTWRSPYVYLDEASLGEAKAALQAKLAD